ncbi:DsrE family protein [Sulfuriflexus mobilis]|uniref:DsrE family protein n=1 Tax=Sulfuriflexus mobilis TaxID=1811807 RepID=UPI000F8454AA|nr:DsrE family protein [Sulfuriflexus mobilis]
MRRGIYLLLLLAVAGWLGRDSLWSGYMALSGQGLAEASLTTPQAPAQPPVQLDDGKHYAYDIVLHTPEQIREVLQHAEKISQSPRPANEKPSIAMVLHGPEIDFFSIENYPKYRDIVDLAAKLDAYNVIEVKMCQTMMRKRGLKNNNVPGFIELVPYGPGEVEKLRQNGYVVL